MVRESRRDLEDFGSMVTFGVFFHMIYLVDIKIALWNLREALDLCRFDKSNTCTYLVYKMPTLNTG